MKHCKNCKMPFEPTRKTGPYRYMCTDCARAYLRDYMSQYARERRDGHMPRERVVFVEAPGNEYLEGRVWNMAEVRYSAAENWLNGAVLRSKTGRKYAVQNARVVEV